MTQALMNKDCVSSKYYCAQSEKRLENHYLRKKQLGATTHTVVEATDHEAFAPF